MSFMTKKLRSLVSIFALAFTAFALISCGDIADSASEKLAKADGKCTVRFSLENASRQANPEHLDPKDLSYTISYYQVIDETSGEAKSLGSQKDLLSYTDLMDAELELTAGKWFFELFAYKNGATILHSVVSSDIYAGSNYENTIIFNLEEYANESGTGSVLVNFTYDNEDVTTVTAQLLKFPSCEAISDYREKSFTEAEITESGTTSNVNFSQVDVKTGSYILLFTVTRSDESVTKTPVFVIVRAGRESASYERELRSEELYLPLAIHFLFEDDAGKYVEKSEFPTFNITEENYQSYEEVIQGYVTEIVKWGYDLSDDSSSEPVKLDDGTYAMYMYFDKDVPTGPIPFELSVSGSALPTDEDPYTVTIYSISSENAMSLKETLSSATVGNSKKAEALITLLEKHNETTPTDATYLGQYEPSSASTTETVTNPMTVKDGVISINDSYTTWGTMGRENEVALVALVAYGDISSVTSYYVGISDVFTVASAETNTVAISASSIGVPCKVGFTLNGDFDTDNTYTVYASLNSLELSVSTIDMTTIKSAAEVLVSDGKLRLNGYTYDSVSHAALSSGIPEIILAYKTRTSGTGGISVTLGEVDTTDLGENFEMSVTESDGAVTVTATPKVMVNGYSYQWYLGDAAIDGATSSSYTWTEQMISNLAAGTYYVMLEITDSSVSPSEHYSAKTSFTVTK